MYLIFTNIEKITKNAAGKLYLKKQKRKNVLQKVIRQRKKLCYKCV